jgi:hypothetical protein
MVVKLGNIWRASADTGTDDAWCLAVRMTPKANVTDATKPAERRPSVFLVMLTLGKALTASTAS